MLYTIIDIFSSCLVITFAFLKPLTEKVKFRHYVFLFTILLLAELLQEKIHHSSLFVISIAFFYMLILTRNKLLNSILALFSYFAVVVCNNFSLLFIQKILHMSVTELTVTFPSAIIFNFCFLILVFLLTGAIGWYAKKRLHPASFDRYQKVFSLVFIEVLLAVAVLIFNIDYGKQIGYPNNTIIYNCILFFLYFVLSTLLLINIVQTTRKNMEAEQKEIEYNQLLDYIKDLEQTSTSLRKFRHDYLNILLSMDLMIQTRDLERLAVYFETHIKPESKKVSNINLCLTDLSHIMEPAVKGIVSHKLQMARLQNIAVRLEISEDIPSFPMEPFDLARVLGFFLDNAIEAASEAETTPYILTAFVPSEQCLTIIVENTCLPGDVPISRLTEEGFSTKGKNRGHGLHQVEDILSAYPHIHHLMQKKDDLFTQTLELYYK